MSLHDARRQRHIVLGIDVKDQITVAGLLDEYDQPIVSHQKSGNQSRGYRHEPRERVLTDDEMALIWGWEVHQVALLRFLAFTALRIGEAQQGYRGGDIWNVPAQISKNTDAHWVHLTPSAIQ